MRQCPLLLLLMLSGCQGPLDLSPECRPALPIANLALHPPTDVQLQNAITHPADSTSSFDESIEIILQNNRGIGIAGRRILIAEDRVNESFARAMLRLNIRSPFLDSAIWLSSIGVHS